MSAHKFGTANKSQLSFDSGDEPLVSCISGSENSQLVL